MVINSGSVLGASGFGIIQDEKKNLTQVPHVGIVDIEDDVIINEDGCEVLNKTTKELVVLT